MKTSYRSFIFALPFLALVETAIAQSPREQLTQMIEQLQRAPTDNALRERIITLGLTLTPSPAVPLEAERRMARGRAAFTGSTSAAHYLDAVKEFEQATLIAPWYGDAYFNLGVAQDKAGSYDAALQSLKLAQLASRENGEIRTLIFEVEYRRDKENSPEARAARARELEQRFLASLDGAKYVCPEFRNDRDASRVEIDIRDGKIDGANVITWINPRLTPGVDYASNAHVGFHGLWFDKIPLRGRVNEADSRGQHMRVEVFDDRLVFVQQITFSGDTSPTVYPAQTCRRVE